MYNDELVGIFKRFHKFFLKGSPIGRSPCFSKGGPYYVFGVTDVYCMLI